MTSALLFLYVAYLFGYFQTSYSIPYTLTDESAKYTHPNVACPEDKPFILSNGTLSVCVSSCGPEMVLDGSTCIHVTKCEKPVLSGGRCMELCPVGYLYVNKDQPIQRCFGQGEVCVYSIKDIGANHCVTITFLVAQVVGYMFGIILYTALIGMFFSTRQSPLITLITWVKDKKHEKMTSSDDEMLINADVIDDGSVQLDMMH